MVASMYRRRMKVAMTLSVIIFAIGIGVALVDWPDSSDGWFNLLSIGMVGLFMGIVAISSRKKYMDVKDIHIPEKSVAVMDLDHLVLQKEVSFFPQLLLFKKQGIFIGTVKPVRIPIFLYPISFLLRDSLIMMLPLTYGVFSSDGRLLFSFKRAGIKRSMVTINDVSGEKLGEYVQEDFKSLIRIKGELKDSDGNIVLPVEIKGFSGDFTLKDTEGRQWTHFYNGYFPYEYAKLFRDMNNDIVDLADDLSEKHKVLLIAMISYVFLERSR